MATWKEDAMDRTDEARDGGKLDGGVRPSRRSLLAGVVGGVAVLTARALGRTPSARADDGDPVILGQDNIADESTQVSSATGYGLVGYAQSPGVSGVWGQDAGVGGNGAGVKGTSMTGDGVVGTSSAADGSGASGDNTGGGTGVKGTTSGASAVAVLGQATLGGIGVKGTAGGAGSVGVAGENSGSGDGISGVTNSTTASGVRGENAGGGPGVTGVAEGIAAAVSGQNGGSGDGVFGENMGTGNGVHGLTDANPAAGVFGEHSGNGSGVRGLAFGDAAGVLAENGGTGPALSVQGKAEFSRSGKATLLAGRSSVRVSGVALTGDSLVLATLQKLRPGKFVTAAVPDVAGDSITINVNQAVNQATAVAWFVVN